MPTLKLIPIQPGDETSRHNHVNGDDRRTQIDAINRKVSSIAQQHPSLKPSRNREKYLSDKQKQHERVEELLRRLDICSSCPRPRSNLLNYGDREVVRNTTGACGSNKTQTQLKSDNDETCRADENTKNACLDDSSVTTHGSRNHRFGQSREEKGDCSATLLHDTTIANQTSIALLSPALSNRNKTDTTMLSAPLFASPVLDEKCGGPHDGTPCDETRSHDQGESESRRKSNKCVIDADTTNITESSAALLPEHDTQPGGGHESKSVSRSNSYSPVDQSSQQYHSDSLSSVEHPRRRDSLYESPASPKINPHKRLASTSGKRGMDQTRVRTNNHDSCLDHCSLASSSENIDSPSPASIPSLSSEARQRQSLLFSASQSPIIFQDDDESSSSSGNTNKVEHTFHRTRATTLQDRTNDRVSADDTVEFVDCTILHKRKVRWNVGTNDSYHDEPNVSLRDGAIFRMEPLRVRCQQSTLSFPDPLSCYQGSVLDRLGTIYVQLSARETAWDDAHRFAVVVSLSMKQVVNVALKLLLASRQKPKASSTTSRSQQADGDSAIHGGALIVVRDKDDLQMWQSALREGTSHSVFDYTTLSLKDRQRKTSCQRCAGFDIVLTTFDSLKAKDIATPLNSLGHALTHKVGYQDGWYSSLRSNSSASTSTSTSCEPLTVLHHMTWQRVIFVDVLGRKSFLSKPGTARVKAGVALNGSPRFIFFCRNSQDENPVRELARHDRKAMGSVAAVLRLSGHVEEQILDAIVGLEE